MSTRQDVLHTVRGLFHIKTRADAVLLCFAFLAIVLIIVAVYWTLDRIEIQVKQQTAESLQTVVATTQEGIAFWVNAVENPVSIIARRPEVIAAVQSQVELSSRPESLRHSKGLRDLREFLTPVIDVYKYDFSVVDRNWIEIASEKDDRIGMRISDRADMEPIEAALNGSVAVGLPAVDGTAQTVIVASPVIGDNGMLLAALVFFLDPKPDFNSMTHRGRIGSTGETYVFDEKGRMLTDSRFRPDRTLYVRDDEHGSKTGQLTKMAQSALSGKSGVDVEGYPDYRDIEVFGAWAWDPSLKIGIATEIDRWEALTPYRTIRTLTLLMVVVTIGTFLVLLVVIRHRNRVLASNWAFRESIKARQDTLAVVSHDLRAPLSNVILCSNMLAKSNDVTSLTRFAGVINRSSRQMEKLISDLLDVSEMEMGRLRIEKKPCDIDSLLESIRETFLEQARSQSIVLDIPAAGEHPPLIADPDRIIQVLSNLVGNALKFTPTGGRISVHHAISPREVRFAVRDSGPGIQQDAQPHIFDQFWKTKSSGKRGRGLGLYIARMIVERHNGKIWVESDGRNGSVFYFTIPY